MAERKRRKVKRLGRDELSQHDAHNIEEAVERGVERALKSSGAKARTQVVSFFDFIRERGVIGLAVGIVIGGAVTVLVRSLVDDIINPIVSTFLVENELKAATWQIGEITIGWGNFVSALIDFLIIALAIYIIFRVLRLEKIDKPAAKGSNIKSPPAK